MKPIGFKLHPRFRVMLYVLFFVSWFSGLGFFVLDTFFQIEGDFGPEKHPLQGSALLVHGAAAFLMMITFGGLLFAHVPMTWKTGRVRRVGILMIVVVSCQVITGYLLYYLASEFAREIVFWTHLSVGTSLPLMLLIHIRLARKSAEGTVPKWHRRTTTDSTATGEASPEASPLK
ncbi:MAG: hypothetical protein AAF431_08270 [Pseudomonadota bacterium]